jgi:hypothetical protein
VLKVKVRLGEDGKEKKNKGILYRRKLFYYIAGKKEKNSGDFSNRICSAYSSKHFIIL